MSGNLHPVRTKEQFTAGFPTIVPAITGDMNLRGLIRIWQHCKSCAQQTETNYDAQNYLYVVLPPQLWPYFSTRAYPTAPVDPGTNPSYDTGENATVNTTIRDQWQLNNKHFEEDKHVNRALVDRFLRLVPDANRRAYETNQLTVDPKQSFLQVFDYFWEQFGMATEEEIINNTGTLLNPWQPHEGMEVLIDRFDQIQIYAFFAKNLMDDQTLINYFMAVIKKTGKYTRAYEDWLARPDNTKTYALLKEFWRKEHLKMRRANPTANQFEYGMNATDAAEATSAPPDIASILEQCANAMMEGQRQQQEQQRNFETQMAANMAAMQQQLLQAQNQNNMTAQFQRMNMQQQMQQQAANMAQAAMRQHNNPARTWLQQQWQPAAQQLPATCQPATIQGNNKKEKTPFRCYENFNYCWTHGHHVEDDHTSATCTMPRPGHQVAATKQNTMGGSNGGSHKTIMPSQSGRTRITRGQRPASQAYKMWKAAGFPAGGMKPFAEQLKAQKRATQPQTPQMQMNYMMPGQQMMPPTMPPNMQMWQQPTTQMKW